MRFLPLLIPALTLAGVAAYGSPDEEIAPDPTVRVRLASLGAPSSLTLQGSDLQVTDAEGNPVTASPLTFTVSGGHLKLAESVSESFRVEGETIGIAGRRVPRTYTGALILTAGRGGITLFNEVSLERYTEGVLQGECPASFHPAAIRAMAIAARSYSFRKAFMTRSELCDTVHCQVYRGSSGIAESIRQAVRDTTGLCALYEGEVIDAVYCSDCGGVTEANENAWRGSKPVPYLRSVKDAPEPHAEPYCAVNRAHNWTLQLSQSRLLSLLGKKAPAVSVEVTDMTESGRVSRLRLAPGRSESAGRTFLGHEWRRAVGLSAVKSLRFEVKNTGSGIQLTGSGFGHGVGLCQFGANGMGKRGAEAEQILKHYYTGIEVGPLPSVAEARSRMARRKVATR